MSHYYLPEPHGTLFFRDARPLKAGPMHVSPAYQPEGITDRQFLATGRYVRDYRIPAGKAMFSGGLVGGVLFDWPRPPREEAANE
jgi:hypothetical protein